MLRILPIFLILLFPAAASAAPADIDRSFGAAGRAILDSGGEDNPSAMAIQPDGKLVVAGGTNAGDNAIVRRLRATARSSSPARRTRGSNTR